MTEPSASREIVDRALTRMLGLRAWAPSIGVGSFLTINFGSPRINSQGKSQGAFYLWVYGASWEVRAEFRSIATSNDDRAVMSMGALALDGAVLHSFNFDRDELTLTLELEPSVELVVTPLKDPEMEEWMLFLDDGLVITAGPGDKITLESAGGDAEHPGADGG